MSDRTNRTKSPIVTAKRVPVATPPIASTVKAAKPTATDAPHDHGPHAPARPFDIHPETLERASGFFRALGDPQRLRLLGHLLAGERCVTDLAGVFDEGLSTISQRLRVLRALWKTCGGTERRHSSAYEVFLTAGVIGEAGEDALAYLIGQGLAQKHTVANIGITHEGVVEFEEAS